MVFIALWIKMGGEFTYEQAGYYRKFKNKNGEDVDNDIDSSGGSLDSVLIDCEKLNCEGKKFRVLLKKIKMGMINMSMKTEILPLKP